MKRLPQIKLIDELCEIANVIGHHIDEGSPLDDLTMEQLWNWLHTIIGNLEYEQNE